MTTALISKLLATERSISPVIMIKAMGSAIRAISTKFLEFLIWFFTFRKYGESWEPTKTSIPIMMTIWTSHFEKKVTNFFDKLELLFLLIIQ